MFAEKPTPTAAGLTGPQQGGCRQTEAPPAPIAAPSSDVRATAVEDTAGALTGTYVPDELATLREDWPS